MHSLFLGTCKDLHASTLAYWVRKNVLGLDGSLSDQLREISVMLKEDCLRAGNLCLFRFFESQGMFQILGGVNQTHFAMGSVAHAASN